MFNNRHIVKYSMTYGEEPKSGALDLSTLEKQILMKVLARLNYLARNRKDYHLNEVLHEWFVGENLDYARAIFEKIVLNYRDKGVDMESLGLINIWTNLTLLDEALTKDWSDDKGTTFREAEERLLDIYLSVNEQLADKSNGLALELSDCKDIFEYHAMMLSSTLLSYHDLQHSSPIQVFIVNYIKSYYLFTFLEKYGHQTLLNKFLENYGTQTWKEYFKLILPLASSPITESDNSGLFYFNVMDGPDKDRRNDFLQALASVREVSYPIKPDFISARTRPLYETEKDRFLVLDQTLMANRIYNSTFFELLRIAPKLKQENKSYSDFFQFYTYEFIEKYLSYQTLEIVFSRSQSYRISGEDIVKKFNIQTEPDYYVRKGNKVFLFEIKGSILTGEAKQSFSYIFLEKELRNKFYYDTSSKENKAIKQLLERIEIMLKGRAKYDPNLNERTFRVYPILLTTEFGMTTPGINYLLNKWFLDDLQNNPLLTMHHHRINDLVIIDIDTFIIYQDKFSENPALFESSLKSYYKFVQKAKVSAGKTRKETEQKVKNLVYQKLESFPMFLRRTVTAGTPKLFLQFGKELLDIKVNDENLRDTV